MFWLGLTNKNKLSIMIDEYFANLSETEKKIIFNRKNKNDPCCVINFFDSCKLNMAIVKSLSDYNNLTQFIEEKEILKSVLVDTLIFADINLEGKQIGLLFQIKNAKFKN